MKNSILLQDATTDELKNGLIKRKEENMNIIEAINKALKENKNICIEGEEEYFVLDPSSVPIVVVPKLTTKKEGPHYWNPTHKELTSHRWKVVD